MDEMANLEFGLAEDLALGLADEQAGQLQDVTVNPGVDARGQRLGLPLVLGGQGPGGHDYLLAEGIFLPTRPSPTCVQKSYQHFSCLHGLDPFRGKRLLSATMSATIPLLPVS